MGSANAARAASSRRCLKPSIKSWQNARTCLRSAVLTPCLRHAGRPATSRCDRGAPAASRRGSSRRRRGCGARGSPSKTPSSASSSRTASRFARSEAAGSARPSGYALTSLRPARELPPALAFKLGNKKVGEARLRASFQPADKTADAGADDQHWHPCDSRKAAGSSATRVADGRERSTYRVNSPGGKAGLGGPRRQPATEAAPTPRQPRKR
jgi:hypothetical protein